MMIIIGPNSTQFQWLWKSLAQFFYVFVCVSVCVCESTCARRHLLCIKYATCWADALLSASHKGSCQRAHGRKRHGHCCGMFYLSLLQIAAAFCTHPHPDPAFPIFFLASFHFVIALSLSLSVLRLICAYGQGERWRNNGLLDALLILEIKLHLTVDCAHNCRALPGALGSK